MRFALGTAAAYLSYPMVFFPKSICFCRCDNRRGSVSRVAVIVGAVAPCSADTAFDDPPRESRCGGSTARHRFCGRDLLRSPASEDDVDACDGRDERLPR
jgi:hypothetical protein|tara:strand:+ start:532 stop:831 length:300 start_codon:yes stop_codon:yes gene_type:complete